MNPYKNSNGSIVPGLSIGAFSIGTTLIVKYPAASFAWSFYTSPLANAGGPTKALSDFLTTSGIKFNKAGAYPIAPGSLQGIKGTPVVNNFNHYQAVLAERARLESYYGSSIIGEVATNGPSLRMNNPITGNARTLDLTLQTRSFWSGATQHFIEVKTGVHDLNGVRGGSTGVQAPADAANLSSMNKATAGYRAAGQLLRGAGALGAVVDIVMTGAQIQQQLSAGDNLGAKRSGAQFGGRWGGAAAGAWGGASFGGVIGSVIPFVGTAVGSRRRRPHRRRSRRIGRRSVDRAAVRRGGWNE
ncbi:MAG: hypothetical protein ACR65T_17675 [Methylocystis sp.]|uniref:hypothetical protein n=1 Tax=Methylocystis sp. TaxID=1911079 RepID=UPI003DA62DA7